MRWLATPLLALLVVLGLFLLMQWMIAPPPEPPGSDRPVEGIEIVRVEPEPEDEPPEEQRLESEPPPPPPPPAALTLPNTVSIPVPAVAAPSDIGPVKVPLALGGGAPTLGSSGAFGGFSRGTGFGSGGGGGQGQGFKGKELIPLSTARPQISQWAYQRGIEGWVEVVYTVMPNGRVQDIKIVDAQPKGVFETAAIESISNWIYAEHPRARMVKQRVEFKLEDFQYNWR